MLQNVGIKTSECLPGILCSTFEWLWRPSLLFFFVSFRWCSICPSSASSSL